MMVTDNLDLPPSLGRAMTMMEIEVFRFPRFHHLNLVTQLPIMISGYHDRLAAPRQIFQKFGGFARGGFVVNQVTENNQAPGLIFIDQLHQALRDRAHPPHRDETTSRALAQFIAEMQVGDGQPAFRLMDERKAAIEQDFIGNEGLICA